MNRPSGSRGTPRTTPGCLDLLFWAGCAALASLYGGCTLWGK